MLHNPQVQLIFQSHRKSVASSSNRAENITPTGKPSGVQ
jgi:hypothetical protein